jgi:ABC-2 type transport system permease protein
MATRAMEASSSAIGLWRAAWLLSRLRLRRQWNQLLTAYRFRKSATARTATAKKSAGASFFAVFIVLMMIFNCGNLSYRSLSNMQKTLGETEVYKQVKRGWLGVNTAPVTEDVAARLSLKPPHGAVIAGLIDGGAAKPAGLLPGDVIVKFAGKYVRDAGDLQRFTLATRAGAEVAIALARPGGEQSKIVKLGIWPDDAKPILRAIAPAAGAVLAPGVLNGAALAATLLLLSALFMTLAAREIAQPEWDFEWLATLPLPLPTLLLSRMTERALTNAPGLVLLGAFLSTLAFECGYRWSAPLFGLSLALALLFVVGALQTLVDTGLRLTLAPAKLKNLQAVVSIIAGLPLLLAISMSVRDNVFVFGWAAALPEWATYLPPGLATRALAAADAGAAARWSALMVGEIVALAIVIYVVLLRQLRFGVVAAGAREAVVRAPRARQAAPAPARRGLFSAVQRRELRLLSRDRAFMAQTLLLPVVMVGAQVFINVKSNILVGAIDHPENLAAIAFALAAYTLMLSAFQTVNAEGQALWLLYSVPQSLEKILREKAALWAVAATAYPLLIFAVAIGAAGYVSTQFVTTTAVVLLGPPIFAVIASALGVFASDPLAQEIQRRVRPTYIYLYMVLASFYAYAVYASTIWQRAAVVILTALLALALWQKARDQFDYLLDPSASPPARVSAADGLIAALMFFVLQAMVIVIFQLNDVVIAAPQIWIAFSTAGAATYGAMRLVYWRTKAAGVPGLIGADVRRALLWGAGGGLAAALVGVAYLIVIARLGWFPAAPGGALALTPTTMIWLGALAVAAAPVFEEFIFRGLIFGGLRRSLGLGGAMLASAAVFAIVHPPTSVAPVFVLGLTAALVYERTRMLAAPMAVHAIYNAVILAFQWSVMQ